MARGVEIHKKAHQLWRDRNFQGIAELCAPTLVYTDEPRAITLKSSEEFADWAEDWAKALPDGDITEPQYFDAGDVSVAVFTARGTQTGPMGPIAPTGHRISVAFCEVLRYDSNGKIVEGRVFYDQLTLLTQLGVAPAI